MLNGYYVSYEKMIFDNRYLLTVMDGYNKRNFSFCSYYCQEHEKQVKKLVIKFGGEIHLYSNVKFKIGYEKSPIVFSLGVVHFLFNFS